VNVFDAADARILVAMKDTQKKKLAAVVDGAVNTIYSTPHSRFRPPTDSSRQATQATQQDIQ
jgi:hypothetical protein